MTATNTPRPCPHCLTVHPGAHHYRDAGTATPEQAYAAGYCPVLALRRNAHPFPLTLGDRRIAAATDAAIATLDPRTAEADMADAYARALRSTL